MNRKELRRGGSKSCGCLNRELQRARAAQMGKAGAAARRTHGLTDSREYNSWKAMRRRCTDPGWECYARYGGRGIRVYERWLNSFENFLADMGPRPPGTSLDRIDNNGHYEPGNCRWATRSQQNRNMCTTRRITVSGNAVPLADAAEAVGLRPQTVKDRIAAGWTEDRALLPGNHSQGRALSDEQVAAIRREHVPGCTERGGRALARRYGVHLATIRRCLAGYANEKG